MQNVKTIEYLKQRTSLLTNKVYYPHRCYVLALTDFYIVCNILKKRRLIVPYVSNSEIKNILAFPASLKQIIHFRKCLFPNIALYVLSKQPSCLCVCAVWLIGKMRRLLWCPFTQHKWIFIFKQQDNRIYDDNKYEG